MSKYGMKSGSAEYNRVKARRYSQNKTFKQQLDRWEDVVDYVIALKLYEDKSNAEIAEIITRTTKYKIIVRSKEINYE